MKDLIAHLNKNFFLSLDASKNFAEVMSKINYAKGKVFIEKGKNNQKEYLLFEGICRSFVTNPSGEEITLSFFTANDAISPNLIRTKSYESILNIQAITNVQLVSFSNEDLMTLMNKYREIEIWGNSILQSELLLKTTKEINQNSMTAKERLIDFRTSYPSLENKIPHSYISSYLGITNVSLSRIRKELSKT